MTLLTADEFREYQATSLDDPSLELLLDAAEIEIDREVGPLGAVTEIVGGGSRFITLNRKATAISGITETVHTTETDLAADDYLIYPSGLVIERLQAGTNSRWRWWGRVSVTYTPEDDEVLRKAVQIDLVKLMLNYAPGLTAETVGSWTTQLASNAKWNADAERRAILRRLDPDPKMLVVG